MCIRDREREKVVDIVQFLQSGDAAGEFLCLGPRKDAFGHGKKLSVGVVPGKGVVEVPKGCLLYTSRCV